MSAINNNGKPHSRRESLVSESENERIANIKKDLEWQKTNPISNLAKKALFTVAQIYRAVPYGIISFVNWVTRYSFKVINDSEWKYKSIWNGLKGLKEFSPQLKWFTKEYDKADYVKAMGRNEDFFQKVRKFNDGSEKEVVVMEGVFDAIRFSGPKI